MFFGAPQLKGSPMNSTYQLLRINGCRDTRSPNGKDYDTVTLADIAAMADLPLAVAKLDAPAFVASSYVSSDARSHSAQRQHGQFHALVVDVDEDGPTLASIDAAFTAIFGDCARIIYSTSSASAEAHKWRAIVPFLTADKRCPVRSAAARLVRASTGTWHRL
jgi:hypothetical protein